MKSKCYFLFFLALLALPISLAFAEFGTVQWVTDGDSFRALINGSSQRIRLICVDAPETKLNDKAVKDSKRLGQTTNQILYAGQKSKEFLKSILVSGSKVRIEPGDEKFDMHGRLLSYVYKTDGTFVNQKMIESGYAGVLCYAPNDKKAPEFIDLMHVAKSSKRGLWSDSNVNLTERWKR